MAFKNLTLAILGISMAGLLGSCSEELVKSETDTFTGSCAMSVPKKMRALRKIYNDEVRKPDSKGKNQSYETCMNTLQAAKDFRTGLDGLTNYMTDYCSSASKSERLKKIDADNMKKIDKTIKDLDRQVGETDCASVYRR